MLARVFFGKVFFQAMTTTFLGKQREMMFYPMKMVFGDKFHISNTHESESSRIKICLGFAQEKE